MFTFPGERARARNIVAPTRVVQGAPIATSNLNFYVSPSGNDLNAGSQAAPFLTIQHALNVAVSYNYQSQFTPTVNLSTGVYTVTSPIILPEIISPAGVVASLAGVTGTPTDVKITTSGQCINVLGGHAQWGMSGIQLESSGVQDLVTVSNGALLKFTGTMGVSSATGGTLFHISNYGSFFMNNRTLNVQSTSFNNFILAVGFCNITFTNNTINLSTNAAANFIGWLAAENITHAQWKGNTVNSTIGTPVLSNPIEIFNGSVIFSDNGLVSDFPGSSVGGILYDPSCYFVKFGNAYGSNFGNTISGVPSTNNLSTGSCAVFKDSAGSSVFLAYNDGGTIKKVSLT